MVAYNYRTNIISSSFPVLLFVVVVVVVVDDVFAGGGGGVVSVVCLFNLDQKLYQIGTQNVINEL